MFVDVALRVVEVTNRRRNCPPGAIPEGLRLQPLGTSAISCAAAGAGATRTGAASSAASASRTAAGRLRRPARASPARRRRREKLWRKPPRAAGAAGEVDRLGDRSGRGTPCPGALRTQLGSRLSALGSRLSALGSRLSALGSRLSALGSRLSALGSRLSALGSRLSALGSRLSALGSYFTAATCALRTVVFRCPGDTCAPRLRRVRYRRRYAWRHGLAEGRAGLVGAVRFRAPAMVHVRPSKLSYPAGPCRTRMHAPRPAAHAPPAGGPRSPPRYSANRPARRRHKHDLH